MSFPVAGVVGMPIAQSLSPVLHGTWLKRFGLPGRYERREIAPETFEADMTALLLDEGWAGMNVTVPHKEAAFRFCDRVDDSARRLGAVNTVVRLPDGTNEGRNTDLYGFRRNLETAPGWTGTGRGAAVVLGAGGAARAVVAALQDLGFAEIRIVNRTVARAERLIEDLAGSGRARLSAVTAPSLEDCDLLVNTTSLGMTGQPPLEIDLAALPGSAFVTDIVYKPLETGLLAAARARGNATADGLGMLLHQAVPGFEAWFHPPERPAVDDDLRRIVLGAMAR
ncbi:shikimate dehydrogenase [Pacificispira sp.]|uniref:shikimate dehydrogenase n=1 Tax=Pacificispira sp. TaxID=2888761 RepID=UPI003B5279B5